MNIYEVKGLTYAYDKKKNNVIDNISFNIKEGEIFGLLGPSGAGKSTTQKVLIKLLDGYHGSIEYVGKNLKQYNQSFYEEVGVGFEMPVHFNKLTAKENLQFFANLYQNKADIDELLMRVGLADSKNQMVGQFSKGMKVRLNFIRALLNKPKMLFLDEVTNGLDPQNAQIVKDMIMEYKLQGGTVLLTTHLMNDVEELCDNVAFMSHGKIVELSSPQALKLKYGKRILKVEYKIQKEGEIIYREFDLDTLANNLEFNEILKSHYIVTIHTGETSLSDIFIRLMKQSEKEEVK